MNIMPRFSPVRVVRSSTGEIKTVRSADDAWKTLLDDWPADEGNCFMSALLICMEVQLGERSPEEARIAFIDAAVEAGVPLLS
ncbi:DUF982 domain-containing protein [Rhizobium sp. A22-96]